MEELNENVKKKKNINNLKIIFERDLHVKDVEYLLLFPFQI